MESTGLSLSGMFSRLGDFGLTRSLKLKGCIDATSSGFGRSCSALEYEQNTNGVIAYHDRVT